MKEVSDFTASESHIYDRLHNPDFDQNDDDVFDGEFNDEDDNVSIVSNVSGGGESERINIGGDENDVDDKTDNTTWEGMTDEEKMKEATSILEKLGNV